MRYPRYTTFGDEELVAAVRTLTPPGRPVPDAHSLRKGANGPPGHKPEGNGSPSGVGARSRLLKENHCPVTYPDGTEGTCRYVRIAPDFHHFQYRHHGTADGEKPPAERFLTGTPLPTRRLGERFANTPEAIAERAQALAASAFSAAIHHEQQDRFRRATPPYGQKPDAKDYQFSAKRAKEIGGRYALCHRLGEKLLPDGPLFDTLEEANAAWEARGDHDLGIACACRWKRRWEIPRFNPLYREHPELNEGTD